MNITNAERRRLLAGASVLALAGSLPRISNAAANTLHSTESHITTLKPYNCTIRIFDPVNGNTLEEHVLPVDSPDAEHAIASTLANAASFTSKAGAGMTVKPVAFMCTRVEARS